jgi:hypothetical protein
MASLYSFPLYDIVHTKERAPGTKSRVTVKELLFEEETSWPSSGVREGEADQLYDTSFLISSPPSYN